MPGLDLNYRETLAAGDVSFNAPAIPSVREVAEMDLDGCTTRGSVDRRSLLAMAGAGLALAGCHKQPKADTRNLVPGPWVNFGAGPPNGLAVEGSSPSPLATGITFAPQFLCVQYVRFDADKLTTRRGYIPYNGITESNLSSKTEGVISQLKAGTEGGLVADDQGKKIHDDMTFIGFGSQQVFAIFLDNKLDFAKFEGVNKDFRVRFAWFSGLEPHDTTQVRKNNAFFNLRDKFISGFDGATALFLDFWNTNECGDTIQNVRPNVKDSWYRYSMNVHLLMAVDGPPPTRWVPIILDPDTGNMGGTP
ncbi:MAG: hypothetical protein QOK17_2693 [Sphingomonadales bacterium]|jgi:hypothetical protein|nr:hypothetical protein [Sphingomonadales bacterium]